MNKESYDLAGQNVEGYKIIKPIGQGKFSIVYKAEKDGTPYALKKLKIFDMGDQKQREKCLKQVDLMRPLDHPNIIKYVDSFIHNNELIIVTEWAEKGDLKKLIKDHQEQGFDQRTIWQYMLQISSGLKHMHQKRIMHRDLKPANIFISHDFTLKIGDLGLGRIFGSETLEAYSKVGTPLYMSPELIQDTGYNTNADVWSLGCICYQLAELNSPFRNRQQKMSLMDLFDNITKCNYKPISSTYSPELSKAIKQMIVVDPNNRLSSDQVFQISTHALTNIKKPILDPFIVMDQIHFKLNLLNYTTFFCKSAQRNPIHKYYFAIQDSNCQENEQLYYFLELCYWIMGLAKDSARKDKLPIYTKTQIDWKSADNACRKLFVDVTGIGISLQEIDVNSVLHGYGESICYLLNQVLNRELVRSNFQFGEPKNILLMANENQVVDQQNTDGDLEEANSSLSSESLEQQSQFEQSIFFRKNKKNRIYEDDFKLLEKIQQFEDQEDRNMIIGKVDEKQWKIQCSRLEKQLNDIMQTSKEARKKIGYQNFQTSKICSSKLTDLVKYIRPVASSLATNIDQDLQIIQAGQKRINKSFQKKIQNYEQTVMKYKQLLIQSNLLRQSHSKNISTIQNLEMKIHEVQEKITSGTSQSEGDKIGRLKGAINSLRKEIKELSVRRGILEWQLQRKKLILKDEIGKPIGELEDD